MSKKQNNEQGENDMNTNQKVVDAILTDAEKREDYEHLTDAETVQDFAKDLNLSISLKESKAISMNCSKFHYDKDACVNYFGDNNMKKVTVKQFKKAGGTYKSGRYFVIYCPDRKKYGVGGFEARYNNHLAHFDDQGELQFNYGQIDYLTEATQKEAIAEMRSTAEVN